MRWITSQKYDRLPNPGEMRQIDRFAWRPTPIKGVTVWLEFYTVQQYWKSTKWVNHGWVDSEYFLKE